MKITRNIIEDLLPLYLAEEASKDSVALIEAYLKSDPAMAELVQRERETGFSDVPKPLAKEVEMEAYKKANMINAVRTVTLAAIFAAVFMCTLVFVPLLFLMFR